MAAGKKIPSTNDVLQKTDKGYQDLPDRDMELENLLGNLFVSQYQVDKLRSRLVERIGGYGSANSKKESGHVFKHGDKLYRVTMRVDEMNIQPDIQP